MAGAPLRTARSSDFSSVRDDYSSWLDEIFPPSRLKSGEQLQHPIISRERQANITAKLRNALPMELPLTNKRFVAQSAARSHRPMHEQVKEEGADGKSARDAVRGSRQPSSQRIQRSSSLPCSTLPVRHLHHHRHRPFEERTHAASTLATPSRHPATFAEIKYGSGRSSHRPGLRFFEHIPSRALISVANTVVFLDPGAAKRAGGEVLWLRTDASGTVRRRVFSSAGCFMSSPKLRRRVALSLCGREEGDGGVSTMRASASAPGAWRRPHHLRARDTGAVAAGTSRCYSKSVQQPAAMLKVDSSCSRHNDSCNNKGDNNNGRKRDRAREKDDGGSTGVLCLDSLSKIEEILVKAGEGEKRLSEKRPDTAPAPEQQQPLPPQELNAKISCNSDGDLRTKFKHDGASQRTGEESHTVPEARAPEADESRAMASFGDRAVPPCFDPLKKNALQLPRRGLFGEEHGEEVPRPRPWAIQKYVRSKGPLAWVVRVVWRRNHDSFCWIRSDSDPFPTPGMSRGGGVSGGASWCNAVRSIAGQAGWEAPKAFVAGMVAALEAADNTPASTIPLRFDLVAVDLIEDRAGKWWLTQVKAFRLLRPMGTLGPATPALQPMLETGRESGEETCEGRSDEVPREPRRSAAAEEAEIPPAAPSVPVAFPPSPSKAVAVTAAVVVSKNTPRTGPHQSPAGLRRKSSCPGLYCYDGGERREGRTQQAESSWTLLAPDSTKRRGRCASAGTVESEEVSRAEDGQNLGNLARDDPLAPPGPREGVTTVVGGGRSPPADEVHLMYQLPLKALVMNDEIVRFRRALITRQHGAAEAAARRDRGHGRTAIHANRIQNLARAPFFDEPARARGGDDVSLQGTSDIESRAIAALRKRDRVRLYDNVPLCAACYREYSENWRWWLARGKESKPVGDGVPPKLRKALGLTHQRPKLEEARERRGRAKQTCPVSDGAAGDAPSGYTQGKPKGRVSSLSSDSLVSLRVLPERSALDNDGDNRIKGIDSTNENNDNKGSSCQSRSTTAASRPGKSLSTPTQLDEEVDASSSGTPAFFQHKPGQRESDTPQIGASGVDASTLGMFRARLDRRLAGISIPSASQTRDKCTGGGLKNAARLSDGSDRQPEKPSLADLTRGTATAAENDVCVASELAVAAASADKRRVRGALQIQSRSVAAAGAPVAEGGPVAPADVETVVEEVAARGMTDSQGSDRLAHEPADERHSKRV